MQTSTPAKRVAVLGLGRMGAAISHRLVEEGWTVTGWSRSGRALPAVPTSADPLSAVRGAAYVVLALFDGPACEEVLQRSGEGLSSGVVVVNTSTVGPQQATSLEKAVRATGAGYVHAPVMGSVPAARSGALRVLAGGSDSDVTEVGPLLSSLGEVLRAGDAAAAAKSKLLANGALGSALLAISDSRRHAAELGLDPEAALAVLERTPLGGLVQAKRSRLQADATAEQEPADFATEALAKDLALLAEESAAAQGLSIRVTSALASGAVASDADVAALTDPTAYAADGRELEHGLVVAPGVTVSDDVLSPLRSYVRGHATGDPAHFLDAFLPTAHVEGVREGAFVSWPLADYCELFDGRPAPDEATRRRRIDDVAVHGTVGTATMTLRHGAHTFTDAFVLLLVDGVWRIANKTYHRAE